MVTCKQVAPLSDGFVDGELLAALRVGILQHVRICADCAAAIEEKLGLKRMVRTSVKNLAIPATLRESLRMRMGVWTRCRNLQEKTY